RRAEAEDRRREPGAGLPQALGAGGMSFARVAAVTRRVIEQFRRDRRTLALLFGVPLVVLTLFWYLLRGGGGLTPIGVVNLDGGPIGARITQSLVSSTKVDATEMSEDTARQKLKDN